MSKAARGAAERDVDHLKARQGQGGGLLEELGFRMPVAEALAAAHPALGGKQRGVVIGDEDGHATGELVDGRVGCG